MSIRTTITSSPHLTVCRLDEEVIHVTIDGYQKIKMQNHTANRIAHLFLYDDGFVSGTIDSFDEAGREIRSKRLDEDEATAIAKKFDLWYYASVA